MTQTDRTVGAGARQWAPDSWQHQPAAQQPAYPDDDALQAALLQLSRLPPLVTSWEIEALREQLAEAARGERFLLQGAIARRASPIASRTPSPAS